MIQRILQKELAKRLFQGKAIVVLGARQTGKTTLMNMILKDYEPFVFLNCDESHVRNQLENTNLNELKRIIGNKKLVFVDEAQRVKNIGLVLKLITDQLPEVQLLVSGSSALELANEINEPLTGRKWEYRLFPISWEELSNNIGYLDALTQLEQRLLYGMYPDVINRPGDEEEVLYELHDSYLYKDLLAYEGIRRPELLEKLLRALAFQVGNEVSYNELAQLLQADKNTVNRYIDLLEKVYVVFRLPAFSRNMRKEISKGQKIYFYDTGIRNAVISNFTPVNLRTDRGAIWENFLISERKKMLYYHRIRKNHYFWRTTNQQEVDLIEEGDGSLTAYEFKWNPNTRVRIPKSFQENYQVSVEVIHKGNFQDFIFL